MPFDTLSDKVADEPLYGTSRQGSGVSKEIWVAVITAGGTIVAALIAAAVAIGTGNVSVPGIDGSPSVSSLERTIVRLQQEVSQLNAENEDLSGQVVDLTAQLEAAGETPASTTGSTAAGEVANTTGDAPITLRAGSCLDLDSTQTNWDVGVDQGDFCVDNGDDVSGNAMTVLDAAPDAATCAQQTNVINHLSNAYELLDKHICVTTSADRYAVVHIASMHEADDTYDLEITVWK